MSDFCNCLTKILGSHSLWEWVTEFIIPTVGAIAIPVLIWYFGSSRAESQKELRQLRDRLNLLLSLCLDGIFKLISLRETFCQLLEIERKNSDEIYEDDLQKIIRVYISPIDFSAINIVDYSQCIAYSGNYVINLVKILSAIKIKDFKIEHHNFQVKFIAECSDLKLKMHKLQELIKIEQKELPDNIKDIETTILFIRDFIAETKGLESKIKDLKLDDVIYSDKQLALFKELEEVYVKERENV